MEEGLRRIAASKVYILNTNNLRDFTEKAFSSNEEGISTLYTVHTNHVVELYEHRVVNHYPLEGELPMTEWLGGTIIIHHGEAFYSRLVLSPAELSTYNSGSNGYIERL